MDCLPCATRAKAPPPGGSGLRRKALRRVRKPLVGRYYQLLSGHAAIGSFLHERVAGPLRLESSECRWCGSGKSHATTSPQSARPGRLRYEGCGSEWERIVSGSIRGHRRYESCTRREPSPRYRSVPTGMLLPISKWRACWRGVWCLCQFILLIIGMTVS